MFVSNAAEDLPRIGAELLEGVGIRFDFACRKLCVGVVDEIFDVIGDVFDAGFVEFASDGAEEFSFESRRIVLHFGLELRHLRFDFCDVFGELLGRYGVGRGVVLECEGVSCVARHVVDEIAYPLHARDDGAQRRFDASLGVFRYGFLRRLRLCRELGTKLRPVAELGATCRYHIK